MPRKVSLARHAAEVCRQAVVAFYDIAMCRFDGKLIFHVLEQIPSCQSRLPQTSDDLALRNGGFRLNNV